MNKITIKILSIAIYTLARALHFSYRYRYSSNKTIKDLKADNKNFIFSIWHQNLLAGILAQTGHTHAVIVSKSKDAEAVAYTCRMLGHHVSRGSSKKGAVDKNGKIAKDEMIECLKMGIPGAVTVDGPKGPAFKAKPGIIDMAKNSGAVIVPYIVHPEHYWEFKSWDQFRLPKPFTKIFIHYGKPIHIDKDLMNYDESLILLNSQMNESTELLMNQIPLSEHFNKINWWASR